ncbi:transposable element Tcb1 transposase [Trichonephila clavipes]|nr:transposable element Tcb1 transposase [Trichonephila clavipes]
MHEQDIKEPESSDPVQSEDRMTAGNLIEWLNLIEKGLRIFENTYHNEERIFSTKEGIKILLARYEEMLTGKNSLRWQRLVIRSATLVFGYHFDMAKTRILTQEEIDRYMNNSDELRELSEDGLEYSDDDVDFYLIVWHLMKIRIVTVKMEGPTDRRGPWYPPQCTTSREDRQIVRMAVTDRLVISRTIAQHIESVTHHSVSARTIRRHLQQSGLPARCPLLGLPFTQNHRRLRH